MSDTQFIIYKYTPTLKDVQELVGGYVETLGLSNGDLMVFNEEGKLKGMNLNIDATLHFTFNHSSTALNDYIVGPAGIIPKDLRGNNW